MANANKETKESYRDPSTLSALLYAVITAVLIFGPTAAPSITLGEVVIAYIGLAMVAYVVLCIMGIRQSLKRARMAGGARQAR